jgi:hypothetical protein
LSTEYVEIIEDIQDVKAVRIKRGSVLERQDKVKFSKASQDKESGVKCQSVMDDADGKKNGCGERQLNSDLSK